MKRQAIPTLLLGLALGLIFLATSCRQTNPKPRNLIGEEEMINLLVDVHIAEAVLLTEEGRSNDADSLAPVVMARIFHKHQVSRERFEQSLDYYMRDPDRLNEMYEKVYNKMSTYDAEVKSGSSAEDY